MEIEEITKLITILKNDLIGLFQVNVGKVRDELKDLDMEEKIKLVVALGYSVLEILQALQSKDMIESLASIAEEENKSIFD
jgi:hypothetical protein